MTETEAEEWARRIWGAVEYGGRGAREVQALLDEVGSGAVPQAQEEFWEVTGGIGGRRIACDLPSRTEAERVARDFSDRMRRLPVPSTPTRVQRQGRRYGPAPRPEAVTLTPDEAGAAAASIRIALRQEHEGWTTERQETARALAEKLGASS